MSSNSAASLAGGIAGGVVGYFAGGNVALGFAVGSAIGGALVPLQVPDEVGSRLNDFSVSSSTFGKPIPLLWGTNRVSGSMIFSSGKIETKIETDVGGKGGPTQTAVSYTYSMDCSYVLGQLPPSATGANVRKIWINSQLVYDVSETTNAVSLEKSTKIASAVTVYDGAEDQEPSSLQESYHGVGNVPAHRGLAVLEFEGLQLGQFGNGVVTISAEVVINPGAIDVPISINAWSGVYGGTGSGCAAYDNGTIVTAHYENYSATTDAWDHVVRRHDAEGNILTEQRIYIDDGGATSAAINQHVDFPYNDPLLAINSHPFARNIYPHKIDGISKDGPLLQHPYCTTTTLNLLLTGRRSMVLWGDYYYVLYKGDYAIGRHPIITDPESPYYGYPAGDSDISIDLTNTDYGGSTGQYLLTLDVKNQRLYLDETASRVTTSWDSSLNLLHTWDNGVEAIPASISSGANLWSGNVVLSKAVVDVTYVLYLHEFDPDVDHSPFTLINSLSLSGSTSFDHIIGLTETLALTPLWLVSIAPVQEQKTVTIANIIADMLSLVGMEPADYDVSTLTDTVDGYYAGELLSARRAIEPLMRSFFIDAAEVDNKIVFKKRGGVSAKTISEDDIVRVNGSLITLDRGSELELPKRVTLSYVSQTADYQVNEQHADRQVAVGSVGISNVALPVVFNDDDVPAKIVDSLLFSTWAEREKVTAYVSTKNLDLVPTDVITLDGNRVRISEVDTKLISKIKISGVIDYAPSYTSNRAGGSSIASSTMAGLVGPTIVHMFDIPILRDQDDGIIKYLGMSGVLSGWGGAILYKSTDSGQTYAQRAQSFVNTTFGSVNGVLADAGNTNTWDYTNSINVLMSAGTPVSASEIDVLNGANLAAIGSHGRWELIQWKTATLEIDGTYTLTELLRGRRATEHNTANHIDSDRFVILAESNLIRLNDAASDIGAAYLYKGVTIENTVQEASAQSFTSSGVSVTPFSPVHIVGVRDGSNNLTVTWDRRSRLGYNPRYTLPLGEDTESYELEFWDSTGVTQYDGTKTATSETYSYTEAAQTTDTATPGQAFLVKIFQISATVDRGYEGNEVI